VQGCFGDPEILGDLLEGCLVLASDGDDVATVSTVTQFPGAAVT
jgi:hypothetical protein